jgi:hypothetical protein
MYVDASDDCNDLAFQLGNSAAVASTLATRQWSIKISQYSCNYENLAPSGCTQYYFGSNIDTVRTFNYNGGYHIANQEQEICIRRERGQCRICWTTQADSDFMVSGKTDEMGFANPTECCTYGSKGTKTKGWDCLMIPGAVKGSMTTKGSFGDVFCGRSKGLADEKTDKAAGATICSFEVPFQIRFRTDNYEFAIESKKGAKGFELTYIQSSTGC